MLETQKFIDEVLTPLPYRPYCSDDLADGLRIRPLQTAKNRRYLQINPPTQQHYLVFDVDRQGAAFAWEDCNVAPPNYAAINPENGHAHLVYKLAEPVATSEHGRLAPLRYLAAIERGYRIELGADAGYSGLVTRNPYKTRTLCIHKHEYDLFELSDWLKRDLGEYAEQETAVVGLGRNGEWLVNSVFVQVSCTYVCRRFLTRLSRRVFLLNSDSGTHSKCPPEGRTAWTSSDTKACLLNARRKSRRKRCFTTSWFAMTPCFMN